MKTNTKTNTQRSARTNLDQVLNQKERAEVEFNVAQHQNPAGMDRPCDRSSKIDQTKQAENTKRPRTQRFALKQTIHSGLVEQPRTRQVAIEQIKPAKIATPPSTRRVALDQSRKARIGKLSTMRRFAHGQNNQSKLVERRRTRTLVFGTNRRNRYEKTRSESFDRNNQAQAGWVRPARSRRFTRSSIAACEVQITPIKPVRGRSKPIQSNADGDYRRRRVAGIMKIPGRTEPSTVVPLIDHMSTTCDYCGVPFVGSGLSGRPWPGKPAARYCCSGCLNLGERSRGDSEGERAFRLDPVWIKLAIAAFLTAQSMVLGLAVSISPPSGSARIVTQSVVLAATVVVMALLAGPLFVAAWRELRRGRVSSESLFLASLTGAMLASLRSMIVGQGAIYFEVVSIVLLVYTFGKTVGARGRSRALAATRAWAGGMSACRKLEPSGSTRRVKATEIVPGDLVEVLPGDLIAVDGEVSEGVAFVRESALSGEPFSVVRRPGDRVWAGTACVDARIVVRASAAGGNRRIDRLIDDVERARNAPATMQGRADRLMTFFFPIVVSVAAATFVYWTWTVGWGEGLYYSMSVLLVACPCALGLATPIAVWSALGRLAERGLIVRDGGFIERLAEVDRVIFDKTGTLTEDEIRVVDLATVADDSPERSESIGFLAAVEEGLAHPLARGFADLAPVDPAVRVFERTIVAGRGLDAGLIDRLGNTRRVRIGRLDWLAQNDPSQIYESLNQAMRAGESHRRVAIELDGRPFALAAAAETARGSMNACLQMCQNLNIPFEVMTGDSADRARAIGLEGALAELSPESKRDLVVERVRAGVRPLFVGDGINDAAAMASAHTSIALASGTEPAVDAAAATLYQGDLGVIPWAVDYCRETVRSMKITLAGAAAYNAVGITLAASGNLHPVAASLLMLCSSLIVVARGARRREGAARAGLSSEATEQPTHESMINGSAATSDDEASAYRGESTVGGARSPSLELDRAHRAASADVVRGVRFRERLLALGGAALAAQGPIVAALAGARGVNAILVVASFLVSGIALGGYFSRSRRIPRAVEMALIMLTYGNLGMIFGWWFDARFAFGPGASGSCCCGSAGGVLSARAIFDSFHDRPGMWLGMILFSNAAMIPFDHCRKIAFQGSGRLASIALLLLGNLASGAGMIAGGSFVVSRIGGGTAITVFGDLVGMTLGMIAGHLATDLVAEGLEYT
jgi:heavy metal translocating P-type ATPase